MVRLTNTLTGETEPFEPLEPDKVRLYVCGLTPYDEMHVGHARSYVAFDNLRRVLEHDGYDVIHVQNVTDVEDKILARAAEEGVHPLKLAKGLHTQAEGQLARLRIKAPHHLPKVSDHIAHIVTLIEAIVANGHAYASEGSVYFDVASFPDYGKLSRIKREALLEESRKEAAPGKRDPADFALWKAAKPGEISWPSPWGEGRPGWHIECSAMATTILGPTIDIHGGGRDLQFPHHENEIAQSEAGTGEPFVRTWVHAGFLTVNGEKMSKSTGNFIVVSEVLAKHRPEAIRLFLTSTHYRSPLDFSWKGLEAAERTLDGLLVPLRRMRGSEARTGDESDDDQSILGAIATTEEEVVDALAEDLDTPRALARVHELTTALNQYLDHGPPHEAVAAAVEGYYDLLDELLAIVPAEEGLAGLESELLDLLLELREMARAKKAFEIADTVRDRLAAHGVEVEDTPEGPRWQRT